MTTALLGDRDGGPGGWRRGSDGVDLRRQAGEELRCEAVEIAVRAVEVRHRPQFRRDLVRVLNVAREEVRGARPGSAECRHEAQHGDPGEPRTPEGRRRRDLATASRRKN